MPPPVPRPPRISSPPTCRFCLDSCCYDSRRLLDSCRRPDLPRPALTPRLTPPTCCLDLPRLASSIRPLRSAPPASIRFDSDSAPSSSISPTGSAPLRSTPVAHCDFFAPYNSSGLPSATHGDPTTHRPPTPSPSRRPLLTPLRLTWPPLTSLRLTWPQEQTAMVATAATALIDLAATLVALQAHVTAAEAKA
jgi:hypothetical protein